MGWLGDKVEEAAENKAFEEGGYSGWIKYKAWRAYTTVSGCECCK